MVMSLAYTFPKTQRKAILEAVFSFQTTTHCRAPHFGDGAAVATVENKPIKQTVSFHGTQLCWFSDSSRRRRHPFQDWHRLSPNIEDMIEDKKEWGLGLL